jgi:hypothetical protein
LITIGKEHYSNMTTVCEITCSHSITNMLESNPLSFKEYLENPDNARRIQRWINHKIYRTWYSTPLQQLFYLTGKLVTEDKKNFFGCQTEIDEYLACELFNLLLPFHPDPEDTNYYDENLYQLITRRKGGLTTRTHNQVFIAHIMKHYGWEYPSHPLTDLLETNPLRFKEYLEDEENSDTIQEWVDGECQVERVWNYTALQQLACLTGNSYMRIGNSFGYKINITEDLAIEIFDLLLKFNPDINDTNYYMENLYDFITDKTYKRRRFRNEEFIRHVKNHYGWN